MELTVIALAWNESAQSVQSGTYSIARISSSDNSVRLQGW
jgi:hypothetical protein